eukprot:6997224-Alexandrium_andersonii.AAC.1
MSASLVGSEMCIRDRLLSKDLNPPKAGDRPVSAPRRLVRLLRAVGQGGLRLTPIRNRGEG